MPLFKKKLPYNPEPLLMAKIESLSAQLAEVEGKLAGAREQIDLTGKVNELKTKIADLEIQKSKIEEDHARERREIEHQVGLHRKQVEVDIDLGKREATVAVREENLTKAQERFEQQVDFLTERMTGEVDRMDNLMSEVLARLPKVEALIGERPSAAEKD